MTQQTKAKPTAPPEKTITASGVNSFTLSEALLVMQYLEARGYLCTGCGAAWATGTTQYHKHCEACKLQNVTYVKSTKGSEFEKLLCSRLKGFSEAYIGGKDA